jgi:RNA polymerase sigma factor (sigma-70 family)
MAALPLDALHHQRSLTIEELSDKQLVQRFAGSADEAAFAALVHRHAKLVLGICRRTLGPAPDVDDVFQATFVVLARKPASIRKQASVASWLYGMAYRLALQLKARLVQQRQKDGARPACRASLGELGEILDEELQRLPAGWRDALVLCHLEGLSTAEAAQRLEWPQGLLKVRLQSARDLLRRRLRDRGVHLSAMGLVIALAEQAGAAVPGNLLRATMHCTAPEATSRAVAALAEEAVQTLAASQLKLA